ncbi:MAG: hypothetical protein HQL32_06465 [Planctomycetes bacterium]|nr:hypothetical protein [Planctomycetota bacterium]
MQLLSNVMNDLPKNTKILSETKIFLQSVGKAPDDLQGKGLIYCIENIEEYSSSFISISLLRKLGCRLPIQVWHTKALIITPKMESLLATIDASTINASEHFFTFDESNTKNTLILLAAIKCPFKEVMLIDNTDICTRDPAYLFYEPAYLNSSAIFWAEEELLQVSNPMRKFIDLDNIKTNTIVSKHFLINKVESWEALNLTHWFSTHYSPVFSTGDFSKNLLIAFLHTNTAYSTPCPPYERKDSVCYYSDPEGEYIFQYLGAHWHPHKDKPHTLNFIHRDLCFDLHAELRRISHIIFEDKKASHETSYKVQFSDEQMELNSNNANILSSFALAKIPQQISSFQGKGIVCYIQNTADISATWICIKALRNLGCTLPIQLFDLQKIQLDPETSNLFSPLNIIYTHIYSEADRPLDDTFTLENFLPFMTLRSSFEKVLVIDTGLLPTQNPEYLFDNQYFLENGAIFWPKDKLTTNDQAWSIFGVDKSNHPVASQSVFLINKTLCWEALNLSTWYSKHFTFFEEYVNNSVDLLRFALYKTNKSFTFSAAPCIVNNAIETYSDIDNNLIFQSVSHFKWNIYSPPPLDINGFCNKSLLSHFVDLQSKWLGPRLDFHFNTSRFLNDDNSNALIDNLTNKFYSMRYENGEDHSIQFYPNGLIHSSSRPNLVSWSLKKELNSYSLIFSSASKKTLTTMILDKNNEWIPKHQSSDDSPSFLKPGTPFSELSTLEIIEKISPESKAKNTLSPLIKKTILSGLNNPLIVEIGTQRDPRLSSRQKGWSTTYFAWLAHYLGGRFISVDKDINAITQSKRITSTFKNITHIHSNMEQFLHKFSDAIDILYIDTSSKYNTTTISTDLLGYLNSQPKYICLNQWQQIINSSLPIVNNYKSLFHSSDSIILERTKEQPT